MAQGTGGGKEGQGYGKGHNASMESR